LTSELVRRDGLLDHHGLEHRLRLADGRLDHRRGCTALSAKVRQVWAGPRSLGPLRSVGPIARGEAVGGLPKYRAGGACPFLTDVVETDLMFRHGYRRRRLPIGAD
jgi:hypothetical protein